MPCYRHLHAEIVRRVGAACQDPFRVADLGAGGTPAGGDPQAVSRGTVSGWTLARDARGSGSPACPLQWARVTWARAAMEATAGKPPLPDGYNAVVLDRAASPDGRAAPAALRAHPSRAEAGGLLPSRMRCSAAIGRRRSVLDEWDQHTRSLARACRVSPGVSKALKLFRDRVFPIRSTILRSGVSSAARQVEWLREAGFA